MKNNFEEFKDTRLKKLEYYEWNDKAKRYVKKKK